jgi:hypothetical protein
LASGSTLNHFEHAYTRHEAEKPLQQRDVLFEQRIVLDLDAADDPTHGDQQLSLFDGYRKQYQYKLLLVLEGETGFPLGGHLRQGMAQDSWGAIGVLGEIVDQLRRHWPLARPPPAGSSRARPRKNSWPASGKSSPCSGRRGFRSSRPRAANSGGRPRLPRPGSAGECAPGLRVAADNRNIFFSSVRGATPYAVARKSYTRYANYANRLSGRGEAHAHFG